MSAVRHSKVRQRVVGVLVWAADAELDVPGERRRIRRRIERCRRGVSKAREYVDTVDERHLHQSVVPERQVVAAVIEYVERNLSRRLGIDDDVPLTGDDGTVNRSAVTQERTTRKRAMIRLRRVGLRRTG